MADCLLAGGGGSDNLDVITADASHVLPTATFVNSSGDLVPGTMTTKGSATYNPSASSQSIASGRYLTADQTIKAVGTTNMAAAYIKSGVTVRVGCAENANSVVSITGSYTSASSSVAVTSAQMVQGSSAYVNGVKVNGGITTMAGATYTPGATSQTMIPANRYLTGTSTIAAIGGNATAGLVRSGYTFSSKSAGVNIPGTMANFAAATITPSTGTQYFKTKGKYCTGNLTISPIGYTNFTSDNIKSGVTITGGKSVRGSWTGWVAGTKDIYNRGSWGSGYGTSYIQIIKDGGGGITSAVSYASDHIIEDITYNLTRAGTSRSAGFLINKSISLSPYSAFSVLIDNQLYNGVVPSGSGVNAGGPCGIYNAKVSSYSDSSPVSATKLGTFAIEKAGGGSGEAIWLGGDAQCFGSWNLSSVSTSGYVHITWGFNYWTDNPRTETCSNWIWRMYFT